MTDTYAPTSTFGWIDFSERDRRRMQDVVRGLADEGTLDELGIGVVRDALAETLFPGTSTIQTRARYFLFVPWIYLRREAEGRPSRKFAESVRSSEIQLIDALVKGGEREGVIGIEARGGLHRTPATIYWYGLRRWGIRLFPGSQVEYARSIDAFQARQRDRLRDDDGTAVGDPWQGNWHAALPDAPPKFLEEATFKLTRGEAEFLAERIRIACPGTLLAYLVDHAKPVDATVDFPWRHPLCGDLPASIARAVTHAQRFSECMHGAALIYNLMLSESVPNDDWIQKYRDGIAAWSNMLLEDAPALQGWDVNDFWRLTDDGNTRIRPPTRDFIGRWIAAVRAGARPADLASDTSIRHMIRHREGLLKGSRARLTNRRQLELYNGAAGVGTRALRFRWREVRVIVNDILLGLGRG